MKYRGFIFTNHALDRLKKRRIAISDAWYTLRHPDGSRPAAAPGARKFYKSYNGQTIEVVARQNKNKQWLILTCWSRVIGDNQPLFPVSQSPVIRLIKKFFSHKSQ